MCIRTIALIEDERLKLDLAAADMPLLQNAAES